MAELYVTDDDATLNRWLVKFSPLIAANAQTRKRTTRIIGGWTRHTYGCGAIGSIRWLADDCKAIGEKLYRAANREPAHSLQANHCRASDQTLDLMLSERRDLAAARRFFKQDSAANGVPDRLIIDKSGANLAGLMAVNVILKFTGTGHLVTICQIKYLNNIPEQDHRFIRGIAGSPNHRRYRSRSHDPKGPICCTGGLVMSAR